MDVDERAGHGLNAGGEFEPGELVHEGVQGLAKALVRYSKGGICKPPVFTFSDRQDLKF